MLAAPLVLAMLAAPGVARLDRARAAEARGDYGAMANEAGAAVAECREQGDLRCEAEALNLAGAAYLYRGDYQAALVDFEGSLTLLRTLGDVRQVVVRLNNIGGLQFYQGQYQRAWQSYAEAARLFEEHSREPWAADARQLVQTGQAALLQRLGRDSAAMEIYRKLLSGPLVMPPAEQARLRANAGALYRRLGDPVKAREQYSLALAMLAQTPHADTRLGVLKNMAIAEALEFGDLRSARELFIEVLKSARASGNRRERVQALLYLGETELRSGDRAAAARDWSEAASLADPEERWKALYGLARVSPPQRAAEQLEEAIKVIESLRAGLRQSELRGEFLADKRDVYDARIELLLAEPNPEPARVLEWMERTRARSQDRGKVVEPDRKTAILSFWSSETRWAWVWRSARGTGVACGLLPPRAARRLAEFARRLAEPASQGWQREAGRWSAELLSGLPVLLDQNVKRLVIVPDLLLAGVPLEALPLPGTDRLLVERFEIFYLPSSRTATAERVAPRIWPWTPSGLAIGAVSNAAVPLPGDERWIDLPRSALELEAVAREMPGRVEVLQGPAARKEAITGGRPVLHIATHGEADPEDSRRSRLLFAGPEYLFLDEASRLPLNGVELVTLSACETARGRAVGGEGVESFGRAFLRAGARAAVASLWEVEDAATAEFMRQFYHHLSRGEGKAEALRAAKLRLLNSGSRLAHPGHWAAFVLYGDGGPPAVRGQPWAALAVACAFVILLFGLLWRR